MQVFNTPQILVAPVSECEASPVSRVGGSENSNLQSGSRAHLSAPPLQGLVEGKPSSLHSHMSISMAFQVILDLGRGPLVLVLRGCEIMMESQLILLVKDQTAIGLLDLVLLGH